MRLRIRILLLIIILAIFLFPQKIKAGEAAGKYMYLHFTDDGKELWQSTELKFIGGFTNADKAFVVFDNLFRDENVFYIPDDITIFYAMFDEGTLVLNLSAEALNYGGTYYEDRFVRQILKTAGCIDGADRVTVLICGRKRPLSEGTEIFMQDVKKETE